METEVEPKQSTTTASLVCWRCCSCALINYSCSHLHWHYLGCDKMQLIFVYWLSILTDHPPRLSQQLGVQVQSKVSFKWDGWRSPFWSWWKQKKNKNYKTLFISWYTKIRFPGQWKRWRAKGYICHVLDKGALFWSLFPFFDYYVSCTLHPSTPPLPHSSYFVICNLHVGCRTVEYHYITIKNCC